MRKHKWRNLFRKKMAEGCYAEGENTLQAEQKKLKHPKPPRPPPPSQDDLRRIRISNPSNCTNILQEKTNSSLDGLTTSGMKENIYAFGASARVGEDNCMNKEARIPKSTTIAGNLNDDAKDLLTRKCLREGQTPPPKPPRLNIDKNVHHSLPHLERIENVGKKFETGHSPRKRSVSISNVDHKVLFRTNNKSTSSDTGVEKCSIVKSIISDKKLQTLDKDMILKISENPTTETDEVVKTSNQERHPSISKQRKKRIAPKIQNKTDDINPSPKSLENEIHNQITVLSNDDKDEDRKVVDLLKEEECVGKNIDESGVNNERNDGDVRESETVLHNEYFEKFFKIESALDKVELRVETCYFEDDYYIMCDQLSEMSMRVDRTRVSGEDLVTKKKTLLKRIQRLEKVLDDMFEYLN